MPSWFASEHVDPQNALKEPVRGAKNREAELEHDNIEEEQDNEDDADNRLEEMEVRLNPTMLLGFRRFETNPDEQPNKWTDFSIIYLQFLRICMEFEVVKRNRTNEKQHPMRSL